MPPDTPPTPDPNDQIAKLIEAMNRAAEPRPAVAPVADPPPAPAPAPGLSETAIAEKVNELLSQGQGGEAYKFLSQHAIGPQMAAMVKPIYSAMGQQNLNNLRSQYGAKFTKREPLFQQKMREFNMTIEHLADPKAADYVWRLTYTEDPTFAKEEADERLATAKAAWEAEQAAKTGPVVPASLMPPSISIAPEAKDDFEATVSEGLDPKQKAEVLEYLGDKLELYGVSPEEYLKQVKKADDPRATEHIGAGPFKKRMFTLIGDPPAKVRRRR